MRRYLGRERDIMGEKEGSSRDGETRRYQERQREMA